MMFFSLRRRRKLRFRMRKAFTLIELLVVIAIIAILAAILFPVFAQAKLAAKATQCVSNIRSMGQAIVLYQNDYEDTYPLAAYGTAEGGFLLWHDLVDPYIKNKQVWHCPGSNVSEKDTTGATTSHFGYNVAYLTTFAMDFSNANDHVAMTQSAFEKPSETVLFTSAKSSVDNSWCGDDGKLLLPPSWPDGDCWGRPDPVHMDKAAVTWLDTHVTRKPLDAFYRGLNPPDLFFDKE